MLILTLGMFFSWGLALFWWSAYLLTLARLHVALYDLNKAKRQLKGL